MKICRAEATGNTCSMTDSAPPTYTEFTGIFPSQIIEKTIADGLILADEPVQPDAVQPASLDLRLGDCAWRVPASFLPDPGNSVKKEVSRFEMHELDLSGKGAVLERGCVYVIQLQERLNLPQDIQAFANPKSTTGRLDVFTRVITDRSSRYLDISASADHAQGSFDSTLRYAHFNSINPGYLGPLYVEVSPQTFSIRVRKGSRLTQLRLYNQANPVRAKELHELRKKGQLVTPDLGPEETGSHDALKLHIDLAKTRDNHPVGWRARRHTGVIDFDSDDRYDVADFWDPVHPRGNGVILDPNEFYIFKTREAIKIPPEYAAEMVPYETMIGEFRVHYAGFFDPGFGHRARRGSRGVLEVRSYEVPFLLKHEQLVAHLRYEHLAAEPKKLYGKKQGSHYQGQGLKLPRQFKEPR